MLRFTLIGNALLKYGNGAPNIHQLALKSRVSYPTVEKYINHPLDMQAYDASSLASILINGLGLTREQILDMKISDLFDLVDDGKN